MALTFLPIPTAHGRALRDGPDAYGLPPERVPASDGSGTPCRHCLAQVRKGQAYLIAAYRPFDTINPYTETGPIFLCAADCAPGGPECPAMMLTSPHYIVRGYTTDERILYGTGSMVATSDIPGRCETLLQDDRIAFIHIRSASNNCFLCRVERA